ncbi:hypothetical protein AB0G20_38225 [Streptomyces sp. NPDC024017]
MRQGRAGHEQALDAMIGMLRGRAPQGAEGVQYGRLGTELNLRASTD